MEDAKRELWDILSKKTADLRNELSEDYFLGKDEVEGLFEDIRCPKNTALKSVGQYPYLHANYMSSPDLENFKSFVASQSPTAEEAYSFWKFVALEKYTIIDLTEVVRGFQYYPESQGTVLTCGDNPKLHVQLNRKDVSINDQLIEYNYTVYGDFSESRYPAKRIHFVGWPDRGAIDVEILNQLILHVERFTDNNVWVHCRAGVGRTGVFVTAFMLYELIRLKKVTKKSFEQKLVDLLIHLRKQRSSKFAENIPQFELLYDYGMRRLDVERG